MTVASDIAPDRVVAAIAVVGSPHPAALRHCVATHPDQARALLPTLLAYQLPRWPEHQLTRDDGAEIDHIELMGAAHEAGHDGRNFVLCPGGAYDRSPCGTGTSAKLACLAADGKLQPGQVWRQASIIGSHFDASYELQDGKVIPTLRGRAHMSAEATLLIEADDPFGWGIRL